MLNLHGEVLLRENMEWRVAERQQLPVNAL